MKDMSVHHKGLPRPVADLGDIARAGWNILREDTPTPVAVLKAEALKANCAWMQDFAEALGVDLAPHAKTHVSPQLLRRQLDAGYWGLTCASAHHLAVYRESGVDRVIFANQLIGRANLAMALSHLKDPGFALYVLADSEAGAHALASAAAELGLTRPVSVLIEMGAQEQRTGVRSLEQGVALARSIAAHPRLALAGVECFEGVYGHSAPEAGLEAALNMLDASVQLARTLEAADLLAAGEVILSAGGSDYFDIAALKLKGARLKRPTRVVVRSGCTLTQDHLHYEAAFARIRARDGEARLPRGSLSPALEVWGHVQSLPEPGRIICNIGKRDISYDWALPKLIAWRDGDGTLHAAPDGFECIALNDQHLFLRGPEHSPFQVGDMVGFGVAHPCTTFDKWRLMHVVNESYDVIEAVTTAF